ncbi:thymocyte selection-associated high mobility group box protein TOX [Tachysurus vachellii]|uniref:thymocyte selection-associated high mobility group box protein TOX n=1 Tax=Tachysurus vachellii TaxID=175792 RepID=UPI00296AD3A8|nr:thymocyte selection-associated high mobility group box protein TOX [Tachysurus vachellii]
MDVRFYPPPPSVTDPSRLGPSHCSDSRLGPSHCSDSRLGPSHCSDSRLGPSHYSDSRLGPSHYSDSSYCNKYDSESMFMPVPEPSQDFVPVNQFPSSKQTAAQWKRETPPHPDTHRLPHWCYPVPGLGDDDFNIPPITPPSLTHLADSDSGSYHPLCPPAPHTLHPFNMQGMDLTNMATPGVTGQDGNLLSASSLSVMQQMVNSDSRYGGRPHGDAVRPRVSPGMVPQGQLTPVNQSQLSTQLGMSGNSGNNGNAGAHGSPSPPESKSATPSPSSSVHEDDADEALKSGAEKRAATDVAKKPKTPKKKKKKDPNEPQKPVSAYALFFRDTQAAIKGQNPNATFGEVSKIVASMWDGLGEEQKQVYKKKTETAKKEYLKQLAAYRATLVSQSYSEPADVKVSQASQMLGPKPSSFQSHPALYMAPPYPQQPHLPPMQPGLTRGSTSRPGGNISLGNMAAASPPPLQISPPLHQHISLQQQMGNHTMQLHSPSMAQGFPLQAEYQSLISVSSPSMDYRSGCRTGPSQGLDWTTDYCTNSALQRDKALYLT